MGMMYFDAFGIFGIFDMFNMFRHKVSDICH